MMKRGELAAACLKARRPDNGRALAAEERSDSEPEMDWPDPIPLCAAPFVPTFPVEVLPAWQRDWAVALAEAKQVPPDLPAMLCLAVAGAALAKKYRVTIREGWSEPLNVFTVTALPPGERKSAVFAEAVKPVRAFEEEERARLAVQIASAASEHRMLEQQLRAAERRVADATEPGTQAQLRAEAVEFAVRLAGHEVPTPPQFWADDATPEALATLLAQQSGRMLVASPEGTAFEIAKGRYSDKGKTPNFDAYLKGHAGDALRVNRSSKDRPPEIVEQPALSAALAVQPDVIRGLAEQASMKSRGFLARWLYSLPASMVGARKVAARPVPQTVALDYQHAMLALWRLKGGADEAGKPAPHWLRFAPAADLALQGLERWLEPQLADSGELAYLAGWANKLAGAAARIAAVLHVSEAVVTAGDRQAPVAEATARAAIRLARDYLLPHAKAAFGLMGANQKVEDAKHVLRWLRANSGDTGNCGAGGARLSKRDIYQGCKGRWPTVEQLEPVLDLLARHHYLIALPAEDRPGPGRRPSPEYLVNPRGLSSADCPPGDHNSHNSHNSVSGAHG
jgi:hypothetical protein